ncbi:hypothetical protein AB0F91_05680 [Amycolatopsis sp. NPDC023774]|uniref:hypothetical protein n=1 Tax=Amycolatopsis sp. NPDC023774 TaxID=3155015 RepID=UPI0033E82BFC
MSAIVGVCREPAGVVPAVLRTNAPWRRGSRPPHRGRMRDTLLGKTGARVSGLALRTMTFGED